MNLVTTTMLALQLVTLPGADPASDAVGAKSASNAIDLALVSELLVDPKTIALDDPRHRQQLLVTGKIGDRLVDLTDLAEIESSDESIVRVGGRVEALPVADGSAKLVVRVGSAHATVPVTIRNSKEGRPINFANEIGPIFTKLTCNSGGCHGKSGGQNGFAMSLLGFLPDVDYDVLVKEGRGRRLFPASPEQSLLLRKATGQAPHGGGRLMKPGDDNHKLLATWIEQGMPYGSKDDPVVTKIEVSPPRRIMAEKGSQRVRVTATYSDGHTEDVTRQALYKSNDEEVATADKTGKITTHEANGEAAIMARYLGQVAVFRAAVPVADSPKEAFAFQPRNLIDEATSRKWRDLGLVPSEPSSDSQFIRRIYVDLCGTLPPPDAVQAFVASTDENKHDQLVDDLLASREYASYMAMKWGAILQNQRGNRADFVDGTHGMALWLREAFANDLPYDRFVRAILTASGTPEIDPPVVWFRRVRTKEENVDNISQLFLGTRIQCARCHHHPFEKWTQEDYYGMAAFFARLGRKKFENSSAGQPNEAVFTLRAGTVKHPRSGKVVQPHGLDGAVLDIAPGVDPRSLLADWMTDPANEMFAKAMVNRTWGHFFGAGIVDPIDDMRVTNPPTNPELLDALAKDFVDNGFSVKHLIRRICSSGTYRLSSTPNEYNVGDKRNFARYYPKRLPAEVLLDAVDEVTATTTNFGLPVGMRAIDLPDEKVNSYFLDVFGRPQRSSSCECERTNDANLGQALHLLNSAQIQGKLTHAEGRAAKLAAEKRPDNEKITELFLRFFARVPTAQELADALAHVESQENKAVAYQNILWALLNTKEFQFNT